MLKDSLPRNVSGRGVQIVICGSLDPRMLILCAAVTRWVGGFDVLYACQDVEFDKSSRAVLDSQTLRNRSRSLRSAVGSRCIWRW